MRPDDGGRHRRGDAPCALLHPRGVGGEGGVAAAARARAVGDDGRGGRRVKPQPSLYVLGQLGSVMPLRTKDESCNLTRRIYWA